MKNIYSYMDWFTVASRPIANRCSSPHSLDTEAMSERFRASSFREIKEIVTKVIFVTRSDGIFLFTIELSQQYLSTNKPDQVAAIVANEIRNLMGSNSWYRFSHRSGNQDQFLQLAPIRIILTHRENDECTTSDLGGLLLSIASDNEKLSNLPSATKTRSNHTRLAIFHYRTNIARKFGYLQDVLLFERELRNNSIISVFRKFITFVSALFVVIIISIPLFETSIISYIIWILIFLTAFLSGVIYAALNVSQYKRRIRVLGNCEAVLILGDMYTDTLRGVFSGLGNGFTSDVDGLVRPYSAHFGEKEPKMILNGWDSLEFSFSKTVELIRIKTREERERFIVRSMSFFFATLSSLLLTFAVMLWYIVL